MFEKQQLYVNVTLKMCFLDIIYLSVDVHIAFIRIEKYCLACFWIPQWFYRQTSLTKLMNLVKELNNLKDDLTLNV